MLRIHLAIYLQQPLVMDPLWKAPNAPGCNDTGSARWENAGIWLNYTTLNILETAPPRCLNNTAVWQINRYAGVNDSHAFLPS